MANMFLQRSHPIFIQMSGAPGSGKSTLAKLLGREIDGVVIDHDLFKSSLLEDDAISFDQAGKVAYRLDWVVAEGMMEQGRSVILDSTCNFQQIVNTGRALAQKYGYTYWYVECKVNDIGLLDERLRTRAPLRSQRTGVDCPPRDSNGNPTGEDSRALFKKWIENPCRPDDNIIFVDPTCSPEEGRDAVLNRILAATAAKEDNLATATPCFLEGGSVA